MANLRVYNVGSGTIWADSEAVYIKRTADEELLALCQESEYAYILTSRQMGKSSLRVRVAQHLLEEGILSISVDMNDVGGSEGVTADVWYRSFLLEFEASLEDQGHFLKTDVYEWWQSHEHLTMAQRFKRFFRDVLLQEISVPIVIFLDEIDATLSLDITDDFFVSIRSFYNDRSEEPIFRRLSFILIGVATPGELIKDTRRTPYNIGCRVNLTDFTYDEMLPLSVGLGVAKDQVSPVMRRIYDWTGGHPYLTQRLCIELAHQDRSHWSQPDLDEIVNGLFLGQEGQLENNLQTVQSMLLKPQGHDMLKVLKTYRTIRQSKFPTFDQEQDPIKAYLKLSGVVKRQGRRLVVRNAIYAAVFDQNWLRKNWPENWWQRNKLAIGYVVGATIVAVSMGGLALEMAKQKKLAQEQAQIALARQLYLRSDWLRRQRPDLLSESLLLAIESVKRLQKFSASTAEATQALQSLKLLAPERNRFDHEGEFFSANISVSPDGQYLATGGENDTARVWDISTAQERATINHRYNAREMYFSPDSQYLAVRGEKIVTVWNIATESEIARFEHEVKKPDHVGHNFIHNLHFSPDGKYLVTGGEDGTARVWDIAANREITRFDHGGRHQWRAILDVQFSPDGNYLVTGSEDGTARVWDVAANQEIVRFGHKGSVSTVRFSPDGQYLATSDNSSGPSVRVWDISTKSEMEHMNVGGEILAMRFSHDGQYLAIGGRDKLARVWNPVSGEITLFRHEGTVFDVHLSPDGKYLATGSADKTVRVWDTVMTREVVRVDHDDDVLTVQFSPDGNYLVTGSVDKTARVWDVTNGSELTRIEHRLEIPDARFSPDGQYLVIQNHFNRLRVWDIAAKREKAFFAPFKDEGTDILRFEFSPDGRYLGTWGWSEMHLWDIVENRSVAYFEQREASDIWFSPDGPYVATRNWNHIEVLHAAMREQLAHFEHGLLVGRGGGLAHIQDAHFSPDGQYVATARVDDNEVRVWDIVSNREIGRFEHAYENLHGFIINPGIDDILFSPDSQYLATLSDNRIAVWDVVTNRKVIHDTDDENDFSSMLFSPDSQYIAIWDNSNPGLPRKANKAVKVLSLITKRQVGGVKIIHEGPISDLEFSYDSKYLATSSEDNTVQVWDVKNKRKISHIEHEWDISNIQFNPIDSQYLATASTDKTARVWDVLAKSEVARILHEEKVDTVHFHPNGQYLLTRSGKVAEVWLWRPDDLEKAACSRLTRNLTYQEWNRFIGEEEPYRRTCHHLPRPSSSFWEKHK